MKQIKYHPITKCLALLMLVLSSLGAILFFEEAVAQLDGELSLMIYLFHWRFYFPVVLTWMILLTVSAVGWLVYLCRVAGYSYDDGEVRLGFVHRVPFDLCLLIGWAEASLLAFLTEEFFFYGFDNTIEHTVAYLGIFLIPTCVLSVAFLLTSFVARCRAGTWWRNNLITFFLRLVWRLLMWIKGLLGKLLRAILRFLRELPGVWSAVLFGCSVPLFFLLAFWGRNSWAVLAVSFYTVGGILIGAIFARRLEKGAERLAGGDLSHRIDTSNLFGSYRKLAGHLHHLRDGMSEAVESRLRSERMKTELITNVSHDIKTPLTSLINYVDLMKKEHIENETVRQYLDVMDRQSARLKKLIEDLIELSKTSTGNVTPEPVETDVEVLLEQILGEYRERMAEAGLTLCVKNEAREARIMADGKLLWRVFDNLLGNICKYSMRGTRVYLDVTAQDERLLLSLRNISMYPLNITAEELTERFVRGDRSRHTEGSGLGLSIAKNLVELQKGDLNIVIDGDLFKVLLSFPVL